MDLIQVLILGVCLVLSLSGCAGWFHPREVAALPPPAPVREAMPEPAPARNIGSIWSEGSSWNELYSGKATRALGDLVLLNPTDSFRISVAEKRQQNAVQISNSDRENSHIVGKITEMLPHGVYRLEGRQGISVGSHYYQVHVVAKIREQDIAPDDTASTDTLFELAVDVDPEKMSLEKGMTTAGMGSGKKMESTAEPVDSQKAGVGAETRLDKVATQEKEETSK